MAISLVSNIAGLLAVRQAILKATQLGIEIVIAEGNHCKIDQESILGYSHIFDHYPNVSVIDDFIIEDMDGGLVLAVMSYFPENGSFINKLNELKATEIQRTLFCISMRVSMAL